MNAIQYWKLACAERLGNSRLSSARLTILLRLLLLTLLSPSLALCQGVDIETHLAKWVRAFEGQSISLDDPVDRDTSSQELYGETLEAVVLQRNDESMNHKLALQRLVTYATARPEPTMARALLIVAGTGIGSDFYRPECYEVRSIGHTALTAAPSLRTLHFVQRTACGDASAWAPLDLRLEYRAAALRALGAASRPVFRPTIETQLLDVANVVRLAAAEALASLNQAQSLAVVRQALVLEPNPLVRGALVHTLGKLLALDVDPDLAQKARLSLIAEFGQGNPRLDALLLAIFERHRDERMIPILINALERAERGEETPLMRHRFWLLLCTLTGERMRWDPTPWREWWRTAEATFELSTGDRQKVELVSTRQNFFGIPVFGREVVFVIDTSGSMDDAFAQAKAGDANRRQKEGETEASRLDRAKRELTAVVSRLLEGSRYQVMTFDSTVRTWSRGSIAPGERSNAALLSCLDRMVADGGTDLCGGVSQALGVSRLQYGRAGRDWVRSVDEIFVLSDGEPSVGVQNPTRLLRLIGAVNRYRQVRINTIFLGDENDNGVQLMRRLAQQNDGICRVVGS